MRFQAVCFLLIMLLPTLSYGDGRPDFNGTWVVVPPKSSAISLYGTLSIEIKTAQSRVTITQTWGTRSRDRFQVQPGITGCSRGGQDACQKDCQDQKNGAA